MRITDVDTKIIELRKIKVLLDSDIAALYGVQTKEEKKPLMQKSGEIISDILGDSLNVSKTETTFEINLAVMNIKHTIKRK